MKTASLTLKNSESLNMKPEEKARQKKIIKLSKETIEAIVNKYEPEFELENIHSDL